jgi:hypothetical protein
MNDYTSPIFCDNCANLALAKLDDAPFCLRCLLAVIKKSDNPSLIKKTQPLGTSEIEIKGIIDGWASHKQAFYTSN